MERITELKEIKKIELDILKFVASFCDANGLRYFLDSGTLLGAVRHQGFIPWDDDIDIIMPRTDYDKLTELFPKQGEKYILFQNSTNEQYFYPWVKIIDSTTKIIEKDVPVIADYGIYIDVFPLDGLPNNEKKRRHMQRKLWKYRVMRVYSLSTKRLGIKGKILGNLCNFIGFKYFLRKEEKIARSCNYDAALYCNGLLASGSKYRFFDKKLFNEKIEVVFENEKFWAPIGYDTYLKGLYGDYMQLPPENKRVATHGFEAFKI